MSLTLSGTNPTVLAAGSSLGSSPATGDRTNLIATMQKFADEFAASKVASGYQKLPSGLIIQWGNAAATTGGTAVSFPIAFPNGFLAAGVGIASVSSYPAFQNPTLSGFTFYCSTGTSSHYWIAIGW